MADNYKLNHLPHRLLNDYNADRMVLRVARDRPDEVLGTTNFNPDDLRPVPHTAALVRARRELDVESLTVSLFRLDAKLIAAATDCISDRFRTIAELDTVLRHIPQVYVAYVITHFNRGPLDELTIFIGGDCYRRDQPAFEDILVRTSDLAAAMLRKTVTIFPEVPALHGGKKGEWLVVDPTGLKIDYLSDDAIIALGSAALPTGIGFSNDWRVASARRRGIIEEFPDYNFVRPDTGSPDVLSGQHWERLCRVWDRRDVDLSQFTCMPQQFKGPLSPSSKPTGYGVATTAIRLAERFFHEARDGVRKRRFLIEALGGVSQYTIEALTQVHGVPPENIWAFDPSADACARAAGRFGIRTFQMRNSELYRTLASDQMFDVWVNNGVGDDVGTAEVEALLRHGIKVFCGAANNFLLLEEKEESLQRIFDSGAIAWPDEAASGGGYTLAVMDVYIRCQGRAANTPEAEQAILDTINISNESLVDEVFELLKDAAATRPGEALWNGVTSIIDRRVETALKSEHRPDEIAARANIRNWKLPRSAGDRP